MNNTSKPQYSQIEYMLMGIQDPRITEIVHDIMSRVSEYGTKLAAYGEDPELAERLAEDTYDLGDEVMIMMVEATDDESEQKHIMTEVFDKDLIEGHALVEEMVRGKHYTNNVEITLQRYEFLIERMQILRDITMAINYELKEMDEQYNIPEECQFSSYWQLVSEEAKLEAYEGEEEILELHEYIIESPLEKREQAIQEWFKVNPPYMLDGGEPDSDLKE